MKRWKIVGLALLIVPMWLTRSSAHGINGHIWVSDQGLMSLQDCHSELAAWLQQPENLEKFQFGASFPDSGYVQDEGREYGETAHWEPFVQGYIEFLQEKFDGDYSSPEAMAEVAFLMGLAQHGMQDEVFDSIFLHKAEEVDHTGQDLIDTGTDFVLVEDGVATLTPEVFIPEDITDVFASVGVTIDARTIEQGTEIVRNVVIGLVETETDGLAEEYRDEITWAIDNFLKTEIPGSHAFERSLVAPYVTSIWNRLHGNALTEEILIGSAPAPGSPLLSTDATSVDSWFTVMFGIGLLNRDITSDNVKVFDAIGAPIDVEVRRVRWGGEDDTTRLIQIRPKQDWAIDAEYYLEIAADIGRIDGGSVGNKLSIPFQTPCASGSNCEQLAKPYDYQRICNVRFSVSGGCGVISNRNSQKSSWPIWCTILGVAILFRLGRRTRKFSRFFP